MAARPRRLVVDKLSPCDLEPGTTLVGPIARWVVLEARPVESRTLVDRWSVAVRRLADDAPVVEPSIAVGPGRRYGGRGKGRA